MITLLIIRREPNMLDSTIHTLQLIIYSYCIVHYHFLILLSILLILCYWIYQLLISIHTFWLIIIIQSSYLFSFLGQKHHQILKNSYKKYFSSLSSKTKVYSFLQILYSFLDMNQIIHIYNILILIYNLNTKDKQKVSLKTMIIFKILLKLFLN